MRNTPTYGRWRHQGIIGFALCVIAIAACAAAAEPPASRWPKKSNPADLKAAEQRWQTLHKRIEASGVSLDLGQFNKPAIPDAENFAAHPLIAELCKIKTDPFSLAALTHDWAPTRLGAIDLHSLPNFPNRVYLRSMSWRSSREVDLAEFSGVGVNGDQNEAARKILDGLSHWKPDLDGLVAAASRPQCQYPVDWSKEFAPIGLLDLMGAHTHLGLRALARLRLGETADAANDAVALAKIAMHRGMADPSLTGVLVEKASLNQALQCLWEGLHRRQWNDRELTGFADALAVTDWKSRFIRTIEFEMSFCSQNTLRILRGEVAIGELYDPDIYGEPPELTAAELYDELSLVIELSYRVFLADKPNLPALHLLRNQALKEELDKLPEPPWRPEKDEHSVFFMRSFPIQIRSSAIDILRSQAECSNARIAIAIERYRLKHNDLPERLAQLVPHHLPSLPLDPMTGKVPRYKTHPGQRATIYSLGWDCDDDDGRPPVDDEFLDSEGDGDWIWTNHPPPVKRSLKRPEPSQEP